MKTTPDTTPALYIGLGVHKEKTSIAIADPGAKGEVRLHGEVATLQVALDRSIRWIAKSKNISPSRISICYEAGACGMWIARMLMKMKVPCTVIAPRSSPPSPAITSKPARKTPSISKLQSQTSGFTPF